MRTKKVHNFRKSNIAYDINTEKKLILANGAAWSVGKR